MESYSIIPDVRSPINSASSLIRSAKYLTAFTGAGIAVGSGIPPFSDPGGLWSKHDPRMLEIDYFHRHLEKAWPILREIFYEHFGKAKPNRAHEVLAAWEARGAGGPRRRRRIRRPRPPASPHHTE